MRFNDGRFTAMGTPHPTAAKLAFMVTNRIADVRNMLRSTVLDTPAARAKVSAYLQAALTQVRAAVAAAGVVQAQSDAKNQLSGFGDPVVEAAVQNANAALATTDPKTAQAIVDTMNGKTPWLKYGLFGVGGYAAYKLISRHRSAASAGGGFSGFSDLGAGGVSLLALGAVALLPMLGAQAATLPAPSTSPAQQAAAASQGGSAISNIADLAGQIYDAGKEALPYIGSAASAIAGALGIGGGTEAAAAAVGAAMDTGLVGAETSVIGTGAGGAAAAGALPVVAVAVPVAAALIFGFATYEVFVNLFADYNPEPVRRKSLIATMARMNAMAQVSGRAGVPPTVTNADDPAQMDAVHAWMNAADQLLLKYMDSIQLEGLARLNFIATYQVPGKGTGTVTGGGGTDLRKEY